MATHPSPNWDCLMFQRGLIPWAKETLVTLILYLYTRCLIGNPSLYHTDVLNVSSGSHTVSQGDPGDPDIVLVHQMPNWQPISQLMCFMFQQGLILRAKETLVTLTYDTPTSLWYLLMCCMFQQGLIQGDMETLVTLIYETPTSLWYLLMCFMFQRGLIARAKETLVTLIYLSTDAGHPSLYDTDVLHVSAGPHTESQGDPGDPDILYTRHLRRPWWPWYFTCIPDT